MQAASPIFPWRATGAPQLLEVILVAQRIHGVPEPFVKVRGKVLLDGKLLHGIALPDRIVPFHVIEHFRRQHKKSAVDPAPFSFRLFLKAGDELALHVERTKAAGRLHGRKRCESLAGFVMLDETGYVDVAHAIAVRETEIFAAYMGRDALQPPPGHRIVPGIDAGHATGLRVVLMYV